jgi:phosphoribosylformylglycinamidine synthase
MMETGYQSASLANLFGLQYVVIVKVFKNLDAAGIRESVDEFEKAIAQSQIIMFPGGFSAGDEPDGSAKFFATAFRNAKMKEAVEKLLCM